MSTTGNVAAIQNSQTSTLFADDVNEKNMVYFKNTSGAPRSSGEVVVLDASSLESFKTTTTAGDPTVLGVVPQIDDSNRSAGTQTIAANASGYVQFTGKISAVNMSGTTTRGQYLIASATAAKADPVSVWQPGVFGVATSSCTGAGTVKAVLFPVNLQPDHALLANIGTKTHPQIDSHIAATSQVHGLPASVNLFGDRAAASEFIQRGTASLSLSSASNTAAGVSFPVTFTTLVAILLGPYDSSMIWGAGNHSPSGFTISITSRDGLNKTGTWYCDWLAVGS